MIYLDTSVAMAHLLAEDRRPPDSFWSETLVASRLLEFETWTRLNASGITRSHGEEARALIGRVAAVEVLPEIVARVKEPFPITVRTLDALHLATCIFLIDQGIALELASYDQRMLSAARKLKLPIHKF